MLIYMEIQAFIYSNFKVINAYTFYDKFLFLIDTKL